ncbi:Hypothetical protein, putative [Bodo saltans]|uniref:DUF4549 domain-containing protein n=1 Tax=Bodo saltans TaxID=75058 RepID=A0A0S4INX2_BODSA|nr:Hypothetical protein, putative [Bodo saltans]|eukprot:CUF74479.1 Hypothetical protein, putative [Bodo saltans]
MASTSTNETAKPASGGNEQPPQAQQPAAEVNNNNNSSLYMDVEETELLHRFSTDNPNMVTFKDTDDRVRTLEERFPESELEKLLIKANRTLEERFPESELEKLLIKANQLLSKRKEAMATDDRVQTLPLHPTIPTVLELRELRNAIIDTVALSEESRASLPYALALLKTFFEGETERLPRKLLKYLQRYEQLSSKDTECAIALRSPVQQRLSKVQEQIQFAKHALQTITTYSDLYSAQSRIGTNSRSYAPDNTDDAKFSAQSVNARMAEALHPLFFRYFIADQSVEYRCSRRFERFLSRAQLIPFTKRYDLYAEVTQHLVGGHPAIGADQSHAVPLLGKVESSFADQLDHLCSCFRIPHNDSNADLQQFAYLVNRKYQLVFAAQNEEWMFVQDTHQPHSQNADGRSTANSAALKSTSSSKTSAGGARTPTPTPGTAAGGKSAGSAGDASVVKVVLRKSLWANHALRIDPGAPAWQVQQELRLSTVALTGEGGRQIVSEIEYLKESNVQQSGDRWKQRAEALHRRLQHRKGFGIVTSGVLAADAATEDAPSIDMAAINRLVAGSPLLQKYHAAQQLRFIRTREFRRKILDFLNCFASILRTVAQDTSMTKSVSHSSTGVAAISIPPIPADAEFEHRRKVLDAALTVDDPLRFVECESFASQMMSLHFDGVAGDADVDSTDLKTTQDVSGGRKKSASHFGKDAAAAFEEAKPSSSPSAISTAHIDSVEVVDGKYSVKRGHDGVPVMDSWAIEELARVEHWLARVATWFVEQYNNGTYPDPFDANHNNNPRGSPTSPDSPNQDGSSGVIDYATVVEDLLEAECWFMEGKFKVVNDYREAYEQTTDGKKQHELASAMIGLIRRRPRIDFSDAYFTGSFTREVVNFELHHALLREIIQAQIVEERRIIASAAPRDSKPDAAATGGAGSTQDKDRAPPSRANSIYSAGSVKGGGQGANNPQSNAPSMSGARVKAADTNEFPAALQRSLSKSNIDPLCFGLPEASINDPRLFHSLYPGSSVGNLLDVYRSLGSISVIPALIEHAARQVADRFHLEQYPTTSQVLEKEVLQEMLVQWRVLVEEDKVGRQIHASSVNDIDVDATSVAAIHDIRQLDSIVDELLSEEDISARKRNNAGGAGGDNEPAGGHAGILGLGHARQLPPLSPRCVHYITLIEILHVRSALLTSLYETEILYALHRRQGKIMGLSVKKSQLGPIDFETRRTFAEVDDLEAFKDTSNPLEEILSVKTEMLSSLSIGEFDAQMAVFDLQTYDGVRRLVSHTSTDFRAALTVQLCTKNMLISVTHCNMVAVDVYFENVFKQVYDRACKQMVNFRYTNSTPSTPLVRCRLRSWPAVTALQDHSAVDANSGTTTTLERAQLSKYFISVNNIKSVFRKFILNEMSNRTSDVMSSKRPETLRKVLRELKSTLIKEYCVAVTMATYQLAAKYHCCALSLHLRKVVLQDPQLNFFVLGAANDVIRPAPRGLVSTGESRRAATCMLTRNGRVDEARYIPNVLQILSMDSKDARPSGNSNSGGTQQNVAGNANAGGSGGTSSAAVCVVLPNLSAGTTYLRSNVLLSLTARMLHHWNAIMRLLRTLAGISPSLRNASLGLADDSAGVTKNAMLDVWKTELAMLANELEALRDPNDTVSVVEYLEGKHSVLFLKTVAGLTNAKSFAERYQHVSSAKKFSNLLRLFSDSSMFRFDARPQRVARFLNPQLELWQSAQSQLPPDERLKISPYYAPVTGVKKLLDGTMPTDLEQALHDIDSMPPASMALHRDEDTFYGEVTKHHFEFIGDEVLAPLQALEWLEAALGTEERNLLGTEVARVEQLVDESREDAESLLPIRIPNPKASAQVAAVVIPTVAHFELMLFVSRRDRLRDLFFVLNRECTRSGWQRISKAQKAATATAASSSDGPTSTSGSDNFSSNMAVVLDDLYARQILSRGRVVCEKEAADRNDTRFRRKQKGNEKEVVRRQYQLLVMEVNKLLLLKFRVEAEQVVKELEDAAAVREKLNHVAAEGTAGRRSATHSHNLAFKSSVFTDFCRIVMARAMCTRPEGERMATFHIPESSLTLAMDTVGTRLAEWNNAVITANVNISEQLIRDLQAKVCNLEKKLQHEMYLREVDAKSVDRRAAAEIADRKYELLFSNGVLEKQLQSLTSQLHGSELRLRESLRVEYQERIAALESDLILSEQRFQAFKKKTFRDVQASLEEIKKGAMLAVGKMENAPLHMKRQALRIAISDDELNTLKEQNAELKQAIQKTKIWYEIKAMRTKAAFEKKLKDATRSIEESRANFWDSKESTEAEIKQLKAQLSSSQYQQSQSEIEIEMLRKDLQVQLSNKKDLVSWKLQNAKAVDELQIKLRKFEKWNAYDMDKIVAEYEKRQQLQQLQNVSSDDAAATPTKKGASGRGTSSSGLQRQSSAQGANSSMTISVDEHKRLLEKIDREKKLKEQAFAKIDEMKMAEAGSTEALVWQRKYFESATELQRYLKELEATRAFLVANGLTLPITSTTPLAGAARGSSAMSNTRPGAATPTAPSFELRPSLSSAPAARPPHSAASSSKPATTLDAARVVSSAASVPNASRLNKKA